MFGLLCFPVQSSFEEARCWTASARDGVAYEESVMFDSARNVRAVTIAMRGPKEWSYFGINEAVLIAAGNEPFMLISGVTSDPDEQCLTAQGSGVGLSSCIAAIASGLILSYLTFSYLILSHLILPYLSLISLILSYAIFF